MVLVLVGFMGCGKSSLLKHWQSEFTGASFDLDELVAKRAGVPPSELGLWISKVGFDQFRTLETEIIKEVLKSHDRTILALGGGAFHAKNQELFSAKSQVATVWIETPVDVCWQRVENDKNRPLVAKGELAFKELYQERVSDYRQAKYRLLGEDNWPRLEEFCKKYNLTSLID